MKIPAATEALYEISDVFCGSVILVPLPKVSFDIPFSSLPITRQSGCLYSTVSALVPLSNVVRYML